DLAALDLLEDGSQAFEIHRLAEAIAERLAHERMIGHLAIADDVLEARLGVREDDREQVFCEHPLERRRRLLSAAHSWNGEGDRGRPAPADPEDRRVENGLDERLLAHLALEHRERFLERKRVRRAEREH